MERENLDMAMITEERRASVARTIAPVSVQELLALAEQLFPTPDHPWRQIFLDFVNGHSFTEFYQAETYDGVHVIYCPAEEAGLWYLPGRGAGPLQDRGIAILNEILESR